MGKTDSRADIRITFDNTTQDIPVLRPGDRISGRVEITPRVNVEARKVAIWLRWFTTGKGDTDQGIVAEQPVMASGTLAAGQPISQTFSFDVPMQPWSYVGHYINILWSVHVMIDVPMVSDIHYDARFVVTPDAPR